MILFGLSESLDLATIGLSFWYGGKLLSQGKLSVEVFFVVLIAIIFGGQAAGFLFGFTLSQLIVTDSELLICTNYSQTLPKHIQLQITSLTCADLNLQSTLLL